MSIKEYLNSVIDKLEESVYLCLNRIVCIESKKFLCFLMNMLTPGEVESYCYA